MDLSPFFLSRIMSAKTLNNFAVQGALYPVSGCEELKTGDTVNLFLDQSRNGGFPESIEATVVGSVKRVNVVIGGCPTEGRSYNFQYESDDLLGSADHIDVCDVADVTGVSCCEVLRSDLDDLTVVVAQNTAAIEAGPGDSQVVRSYPESGTNVICLPLVDQIQWLTLGEGDTATGVVLVLPSSSDSRIGQEVIAVPDTADSPFGSFTIVVSGGGTLLLDPGAFFSFTSAATFRCLSTEGNGTWVKV